MGKKNHYTEPCPSLCCGLDWPHPEWRNCFHLEPFWQVPWNHWPKLRRNSWFFPMSIKQWLIHFENSPFILLYHRRNYSCTLHNNFCNGKRLPESFTRTSICPFWVYIIYSRCRGKGRGDTFRSSLWATYALLQAQLTTSTCVEGDPHRGSWTPSLHLPGWQL